VTKDDFVNALCLEGLRVTPEMRPELLDFIRAVGEAIYDPALADQERKQIQYAIQAFDSIAASLHRFVDYGLLKLRDGDYGKQKIE
jgi:hypothetical protein